MVRPATPLGPIGLVLPTFVQDTVPPWAAAPNPIGHPGIDPLSDLATTCRRAEAQGADVLWACDHLYWHGPSLECLTVLTVAATATERAILGTCVVQLPLRQAPAVAKQAATLQTLTRGRVILGVGVGSHVGEYEQAGIDYHTRGRLLDAGITELRRSWATGQGITRGGTDSGATAGQRYRQLPEPPAVPVWVGGSSEAALLRAATLADGWMPLFVRPPAYEQAIERLHKEVERAGRPSGSVTPSIVLFVSVSDDAMVGLRRGADWMSSLYGIPAKAFERHLFAGTADEISEVVAAYRRAGAEHVALYVTADEPFEQFERVMAALPAARPPQPEDNEDTMDRSAHIVGTAITPMNRRDRTAVDMANQVVADALAEAGVDPADVNLVVFGNAAAGRLVGQGCIRGQSFLGGAGLRNAGVVNVDNSCAGGSSALHLASLATLAGTGTVLAVGVEKMWTGDRAETLAGIEDGVPLIDRTYLHDKMENPSGSVLMALNASWAVSLMEERGATVEQFVAAAVKARRHGALNPVAQFQKEVSLEEVLESTPIVWPLTRLMCSSFTDGAAAVVLSAASAPGVPRIRASTVRSGNGDIDYHDRLSETGAAAWNDAGIDPADVDVVELHDATSPEELFALESLGFFKPGDAGPATIAGDTSVGGKGVTVNTSGGLVARGTPLGATGLAQVVELTSQLRNQAGARQVEGARLAVAVNTGGMIGSHTGRTDAAFIGIHVLEGG